MSSPKKVPFGYLKTNNEARRRMRDRGFSREECDVFLEMLADSCHTKPHGWIEVSVSALATQYGVHRITASRWLTHWADLGLIGRNGRSIWFVDVKRWHGGHLPPQLEGDVEESLEDQIEEAMAEAPSDDDVQDEAEEIIPITETSPAVAEESSPITQTRREATDEFRHLRVISNRMRMVYRRLFDWIKDRQRLAGRDQLPGEWIEGVRSLTRRTIGALVPAYEADIGLPDHHRVTDDEMAELRKFVVNLDGKYIDGAESRAIGRASREFDILTEGGCYETEADVAIWTRCVELMREPEGNPVAIEIAESLIEIEREAA